jgi:hypothetical protein
MKRVPRWPVPIGEDTQRAIVALLLDVAKKGGRNAVAAGKIFVSLRKLDVQQQALDLRRERQEGRRSELSLADLVADAERRHAVRKIERGAKATK